MDTDLEKESLGIDKNGKEVYLKDIWPTSDELDAATAYVTKEMFLKEYSQVYEGDERWKSLKVPEGNRYKWDSDSTYVKAPTFFEGMAKEPKDLTEIKGIKTLALLGDTITTDHISPAGSIPEISPAGSYLKDNRVSPLHFNSYGSRRGNHEVMIRGTFGNIRIRNLMLDGVEGGFTLHPSSQDPQFIFDAATQYGESGTPLLILAGKDYGTGSSRDWAAKGTMLLGIKAVLAESFERIHRSNLIGMGVLPLQFEKGQSYESLELTGCETFDILGLSNDLKPGQCLTIKAVSGNKREKTFKVITRADTNREITYLKHGGILQFVLRKLSGNN